MTNESLVPNQKNSEASSPVGRITYENFFPKVDFETWRQFVIVSDSGGFLPASRVLKIDSTAISRRMKALEDTLKLELFHKDSRGLFLTVAGQSLLVQVRDKIENISRLLSSLSDVAPSLSTSVCIGLSEDLARSKVLDFFTELEYANPGARISFQIVPSNTLEVPAGVDCLLALKRKALPEDIVIGEIPSVAFVSPSYITNFGIPQNPEELLNHKIIEPQYWDNALTIQFQKDNFQLNIPNPIHETYRHSHLILKAVSEGKGIALMVPKLVVIPHNFNLLPILEDWHAEKTYLVLLSSEMNKDSLEQKILTDQLRHFLKTTLDR